MLNTNEYIKANYGRVDMTVEEIAEAVQLTSGTVRVYAQRMGCYKNTIFPTFVDEEWKSLHFLNLSNYFISSYGKIKNIRGQLLKSQPHHQSGYLQIRLVDDDGQKVTKLVHKLVALAFIGFPTSEDMQIDHIDCDRTNAALDNIRYVTTTENILRQSARKTGRILTLPEVREICELLESGASYTEIMQHNSFYTKAKIEGIRQRKRWCNVSKDYTW